MFSYYFYGQKRGASRLMKAPSGKHKDLILVRAGPRSLHQGWMAPSEDEQAFDLMVLAYGHTTLALERGDFGHVDIPGSKVAGYGVFFRHHRDIVERYDQIALIDDDIETDSRTISRAFELGRVHKLDVWQPSLTWDSHFSYAALLTRPGAPPIRPVNFVEMMCPFFKTSALLKIEDLFHIGAETAIDIFWSCALGRPPGSLAVLNDVSVVHTRPVGELKAMNGFDDKMKDYSNEISRLMVEFGIPSFPGAIPLAPLGKEPHSPLSRLYYAQEMLMLMGGLNKTPMKLRRFLWILAGDILKVLFRSGTIPADPERILSQAKKIRIEQERRDQESGNVAV